MRDVDINIIEVDIFETLALADVIADYERKDWDFLGFIPERKGKFRDENTR